MAGSSNSVGSTGTGLTQSQNPTGRERAIEALIDREPFGSFYRASRVIVSFDL